MVFRISIYAIIDRGTAEAVFVTLAVIAVEIVQINAGLLLRYW